MEHRDSVSRFPTPTPMTKRPRRRRQTARPRPRFRHHRFEATDKKRR